MQTNTTSLNNTRNDVSKLVTENAVIVFGQRGCCMCHVVKLLLLGLGVNPTIFAVDEDDVSKVIGQLSKLSSGDGKVVVEELPVVYVGGKLFGGLNRLMETHITGELVPILKEAKALWL
uniref:glutaredoxin-C9-like n=1 Tax=Erigeron canadensis TaxID=72917 RepID=UPI001CB8D5CE|nr:glutaredoxin-C9-like [Erigeron canadensis]